MKLIARIFLLFACVFATSCSQQELIDKFTPHPESELAKQAFTDLRAGKFDSVKTKFAPQLLQTANLDATLREMANYFPAGEPKTIKVVGSHSMTTGVFGGKKSQRFELTYEYEFPSGWALANAVLVEADGDTRIVGMHVNRLTQSLEALNAFTLTGKSQLSLFVLALACAIPVFCLYAFIACLRTPMARRKWLWAIFTLLGVVSVHLNWSTESFSFQPLSFLLFGAGATSEPYGPWMISIAFPLGAVWFLARRKKLRRQPAIPPAMNETQTPTIAGP
jgi:hypothetical protein